MLQILIFILGVIVGGVAVILFRFSANSKSRNKEEDIEAEESKSFIAKQTLEKEENKEKILGIFSAQSSITNNDVEKMLGVSDATATRYLDELEEEGKVRQVGKTGRHVYYEKAR